MIGKKFGMLTVVSEAAKEPKNSKHYICLCDCGIQTRVLSSNLTRGNSTSCGCKRKKTCAKRMAGLNARHLQTNTKLWRTWKGIVERTTKPYSMHYPRYGGAGIGIFKDWLVYEEFAKYIGQPPTQHHSIDRIDNSKGYFPGNVRWATMKEQARNRKTNVWVTVNDCVMTLSEAAQALGISKSTACRWVKSGKLTIYEQQKS